MPITAIDLKIANSTEYTGAGATDYDAQACADYIARGMRTYCRENYPEAEVDVSYVPETLSAGNKTHAWGDDGTDDDVELELHTESERLFAEWCQFYATPIRSTWIATGAARREGRQPSHDGEYVTVYAWRGDPGAWVASDNGGLCGGDCQTFMASAIDAGPVPEEAYDDEGEITEEHLRAAITEAQEAADDATYPGDVWRLLGLVATLDAILDALLGDQEAKAFAARVAAGEDIGDVVDRDHMPGASAADNMRAAGWPVPSEETEDEDDETDDASDA